MDADLRQRLTARLTQWRVEVMSCGITGSNTKPMYCSACVHEVVEDLAGRTQCSECVITRRTNEGANQWR